jgi:shikimate kinase
MPFVVLVGMPGVGKTTVGRLIARTRDVEFIDLDEQIERDHGVSPADIIRDRGVEHFRDLEVDALSRCIGHSGVLSCGGGVVTREEARRMLTDTRRVVWLNEALDAIAERVAHSDRPLLGADPRARLEELWAERRDFYAQVARGVIDVNGSAEDVAREVCALVETWDA